MNARGGSSRSTVDGGVLDKPASRLTNRPALGTNEGWPIHRGWTVSVEVPSGGGNEGVEGTAQ